MWQAIGGMILTVAALIGLIVYYGHLRWEAGYEAHKEQLAENRAERRAEQRARAARAGFTVHQPAPFPGDEAWEFKANTGELARLSALAESGDMAGIRGEVAAFFRTWDLREWTRKKRETAA